MALELLVAESGAQNPPLLLAQLLPAGGDPVATALLESAPGGRRKLLPGPPMEAPPEVVRDWHRDAWWALAEGERRSVALATGPGAASLAPLIEGSDVVGRVREPFEALAVMAGAGVPPPAAAMLRTLDEGPVRLRQQQLRPLANPQARSLLLAWPEADELPLTLGPPPDADRWRALLFEEAGPRVRLAAPDDVTTLAGELAERLGYPPKVAARTAEIAERLRPRAQEVDVRPRHADLLQALNWLDHELYERCVAARPQ